MSSWMRPVADDIARTTGLMLDAEAGQDENGPFVRVRSWTQWGASDATAAAALAQEQWLIEDLGRAWPRCLKHGRHPMIASDLSWCCSIDGEALILIGSLTEEGPDPAVSDGRVRWYLGNYGFGAIAHREGDLWFSFSSIEMEGYRSLDEDDVVEFEVAPGRQGAYRRASRVRKIARD